MSTTRHTSTQGATTNPTDLPPTPQTQDAPQGWERFTLFVKNGGHAYAEYMRITLAQLAGKIASTLISTILLAFGLMLFLFLLCAALAVWMGGWLGSYPLGILSASAVWILTISMVLFLRKRLIFPPLFQQMYNSLQVDNQNGGKTRERPTANELMERDQELKATIDALPARLAAELSTLLRYMTLGMVQRATQAMRDKLKGKPPSKGDAP